MKLTEITKRHEGGHVPEGWSFTENIPSDEPYPRIHLDYRRKLNEEETFLLHVSLPNTTHQDAINVEEEIVKNKMK